MKFIIVLAALAAVAVARPEGGAPAPVIPILEYSLTRDDFGQFALSYLTGDGTRVTEQGALVPNADNTGHVLVKQGTLSYFAPDGTPIDLTWTSDADGFKAKGDHLPVPPKPIDPAPESL
ncbi:endocuticle structural glycoprotein SgAbd-2-like [Athalia rosae]|uniref:endocuticle structural glycoprotein SgAbd-2-like n=1 Tax=Athalia rosae TaxID=37344 RepID=UPI00203405C9|nr:endocuticle structural glycoprotein SgAbd-2-like [Athalia rosae]